MNECNLCQCFRHFYLEVKNQGIGFFSHFQIFRISSVLMGAIRNLMNGLNVFQIDYRESEHKCPLYGRDLRREYV